MLEPEEFATFPLIDLDVFRRIIFWLTYKRAPYGSGTNLSYQDCMEMEFDQIVWWNDFLADTIRHENQALKGAPR